MLKTVLLLIINIMLWSFIGYGLYIYYTTMEFEQIDEHNIFENIGRV